jgi:hypothetical protein
MARKDAISSLTLRVGVGPPDFLAQTRSGAGQCMFAGQTCDPCQGRCLIYFESPGALRDPGLIAGIPLGCLCR